MVRKYDVVIVGGGPSGLYAARSLSQNGLDVVVVERKDQIGTNIVCTGIIGKEVLTRFSLRQDSVLGEIRKIKVVSPCGEFFTYQHPFPFACIVDRKKFDQSLADEAQKAGAKIELGVCASEVFSSRQQVEVLALKDGQLFKKYYGRMAILATGIDYSLHKQLNLGSPKDFLFGAQAEVDIPNGSLPTIFIGKDVAPGAFAWAVPLNSKKVRIGLLAEDSPRMRFQNLWEKYSRTKDLGVSADLIRVRAIAQGLVSKTYGERVMAIGEAAGQVKTTTGGGIYFGLFCSQIASEVILKGYQAGSFQENILSAYEKLWKKAIQKEILVGYYVRKLFSKLSEPQIEKLFEIARSDGIIPLVQEKGNFDQHSELILNLIKKVPLFRIIKEI